MNRACNVVTEKGSETEQVKLNAKC